MFREPEATETKATIKADPTATLRSRIRRTSTARLHTHERDQSTASRRRSHQSSNLVADRRALLNLITRDGENATATSNIASSGNDRNTDSADLARAEASNRRRFENGRALLRDVLSYERPGHRMRVPRESSLRYEMPPPPELEEHNRLESGSGARSARSAGGLSRSPPPEYMPTPSPDETMPALAPRGPAGRNPSLTPRFAPAHRFDDNEYEGRYHPSTSVLRPSSRPRNDVVDYVDNAYSSPPEDSPQSPSWHSGFYGSSSSRSRDHTDGLGDRRRSFSPEDENQWETLLTTITPDPRLPSTANSRLPSTASSSFISEAASISNSNSNSNSASSSDTLLTAPSSTLNYPPTTICDDLSDSWPDSSSSASDCDEPLEYSRHAERRRRVREEALARSSAHQYIDPSDHHSESTETRRRASRHVAEHFYPGNRRGIAARETELQQMHAILARLDRQEEVPDEWWAAAGLTRVGQGLVRAERGRL